MRKIILVFLFCFFDINLYGQTINPEYLPKKEGSRNIDRNKTPRKKVETISKKISEPNGCIETANETVLNGAEISGCLSDVSKFIDYLEREEPRPKNEINRWKRILDQLEDKNKKLEKVQKNRVSAVRRRRQEEVRVETNSNLQGCSLSTVYINPNYQKKSRFKNGVAVRVNNTSQNPININSPSSGKIIENLCSGGSVTFYLYWQ